MDSRRTMGRDSGESSEDDLDGITQIDNRSWYSGTQTEPVVIDSDEDVDVFGSVQEAEGSRLVPPRGKTTARRKGKVGKVGDSSENDTSRQSSLLAVRNDVPLFDPRASDTDMDGNPVLPSMQSLRARGRSGGQRLHCVEIPHVSRKELDQYDHLGPPEDSPFLLARTTPAQISPTPPTTVAGYYPGRPISLASSEADFGMRNESKDDISSQYDAQVEQDEHDVMPYETQFPSESPSSVASPSRQEDRGRSSSDPIGQDWESRAGASEAQNEEYDDGDASDGDEEAEDEESYEEEEEEAQHSDRVKKCLRGYDERREASKLALQQRLRNGPPRITLRVSNPSPNPSAITISSGTESAMPAFKRPLKRKLETRSSNAVIAVNSDSQYDEGEDEIEENTSSDLDDAWNGKKSTKGKGKARGKGKGGRNGGKRVKSETPEKEDDILMKHREFCEKCRQGPAGALLAAALKKKKKGVKKKRKDDDDDEVSEDEAAEDLQGWLECEGCVTSWHWGCLGATQQQDALQHLAKKEGPPGLGVKKRKEVTIDESVTFQCRKCFKSPNCVYCNQAEVQPEDDEEDGNDAASNGDKVSEASDGPPHIQFRCLRCTQSAHYEHLPDIFFVDDVGLPKIAAAYQKPDEPKGEPWLCYQCRIWKWKVDIVIAWRPYPAGAQEEDIEMPPSWNSDLPREYLVKFMDRGFRHTTWVTHPWLRYNAPSRLRNFLEKGPTLDLITDETLAAKGDEMTSPTIAKVLSQQAPEDEGSGGKAHHHPDANGGAVEEQWRGAGPAPDVHAKTGLPIAWSTIDRVLDIYLTAPPIKKKKGRHAKKRISSDSESGYGEYEGEDGMFPRDEGSLVHIEDWERLAGRQLGEDDSEEIAGKVTWCFAKWDDLQYDQSTWDTPPPRNSELYTAYKRALKRYLGARNVMIPILTPAECKKRDAVRFAEIEPPSTQPDCVVGGTLMPFQMEGLQWLLTKYYKRESAILADDMGLGKTVQIAALLGYIGAQQNYPCLVVAPNSTITNWVREFEKWVPHMRVVPFYGEIASRKVIREFELYHRGRVGQPEGLKAHVVLTTYDMITGKDFKVFRSIPRWESLVVDEGQKLKSDGSIIWSNLSKLNSAHRLLLTGTPLNNNIRELFNLLNFLDPHEFTDRAALEKRFDQDNLTEELVRELHALAQPYILRRVKDDVLRLPPKVEIIVPISLTRTQVEVYKYVLESNLERLESAMAERKKRAAQKAQTLPVQIEGGHAKDDHAATESAVMDEGAATTDAPAFAQAGLAGPMIGNGDSGTTAIS